MKLDEFRILEDLSEFDLGSDLTNIRYELQGYYL